jgi:hypothetical protein
MVVEFHSRAWDGLWRRRRVAVERMSSYSAHKRGDMSQVAGLPIDWRGVGP